MKEEPRNKNVQTPFYDIYDSFLGRITTDEFMNLTELDTFMLLQELLLNAIPLFKLPRFDSFDYEEGYLTEETYQGVDSDNIEVPAIMWVGGAFNCELTKEEINILAVCMVIEWYGKELTTTELTRMKYSGSDFKFSSQANHMAKIKVVKESYRTELNSLQDKYKRRWRTSNGMVSTLSKIVAEKDPLWP